MKMVKLQVNNSGAWKDVLKFDASENHVGAEIQDAVHQMGIHDPRNISFRIAIDDSMNEVLLVWTKAEGWKEWRHAIR